MPDQVGLVPLRGVESVLARAQVDEIPAQKEVRVAHRGVREHGLRDDVIEGPRPACSVILPVVRPRHPRRVPFGMSLQMLLQLNQGVREMLERRLSVLALARGLESLGDSASNMSAEAKPRVRGLGGLRLLLNGRLVLLVVVVRPGGFPFRVGRPPVPGPLLHAISEELVLRVPLLPEERQALDDFRLLQIPAVGLEYRLPSFFGLVASSATFARFRASTFCAVQDSAPLDESELRRVLREKTRPADDNFHVS
ncbi:MAG: hypothetical protein BWY99_02480 [Synergistetes bacterium ADurb.BinA166]|nr:MAG: hypothetical protein BWY99_02480 [Synergistetes bacterium ADurb.BinA166]